MSALRTIFCWLALVPVLCAGAEDQSSSGEFFEREVRPLLAAKCFACHSGATDDPGGDVRFDSRDAIQDSGAVIAGDAESSLLIEVIGYESGLDMPPDGPLKPSEIATLRKWVDGGAHWPKGDEVEHGFDLAARARSHWAWQSIEPGPVPVPADEQHFGDVRGAIDSYILDGLKRVELGQADEVDRPTLLRRLHFVTTGLPPTPEDVADFIGDDRPDAVRRVVDRLLADPQFGVRWSRHWLDLVRYGETYGHEFDYELPHAWRYRDYVVGAFNDDIPFDQFAKEQIAGDLLDDPRIDPIDQTNVSKIGSAFWWLGESVHAPVDVKDDQAIRIDNQIDVASKTFLGMTVACARCHDHKFDAISQADYTAMVGLLQSTTRSTGWIDPQKRFEKQVDRVKQSHDRWASLIAKADPPVSGESTLPTDLQVLFDLSAGWPDESTMVGWAFERPSTEESAAVVTKSAQPSQTTRVETHPSGWLDSRKLGKSAVGVWRSPTFVIEQPNLVFQAAGDGRGKVRLIIDGYYMTDYHQLLFGGTWFKPKSPKDGDRDAWYWHVMSGDLHHYIGHTAHIEVSDEGDGWVGLARVFQSSEKGKPLASIDGVQVDVVESDLALSDYMRMSGKDSFAASPVPILQSAPLEPRDAPLAIRGDVHLPGDLVPRGDLTALSQHTEQVVRDRRSLAESWASAKNPLFARVAVNRFWHHVYGRGIVASTDNFGVLGQRPTHPELLDHLAADFMANGWSAKRSIRKMLLARTFASDSRALPEMKNIDPTNDFWARASIRRSEGEVIRDSLLTISGRLDREIGGRSVPIHLDAFMTGRGRPKTSGPLDGNGRRSVFVEVRRNFPSPFLTAFDTPQPSTTAGKRNQSNVPAQALAMLNDPLVEKLLDRWTDRMAGSLDDTTQQVVTQMYLQCFGRQPSPSEMGAAVRFVDEADDAEMALRDLADILVNTKEFTHVR